MRAMRRGNSGTGEAPGARERLRSNRESARRDTQRSAGVRPRTLIRGDASDVTNLLRDGNVSYSSEHLRSHTARILQQAAMFYRNPQFFDLCYPALDTNDIINTQ